MPRTDTRTDERTDGHAHYSLEQENCYRQIMNTNHKTNTHLMAYFQ